MALAGREWRTDRKRRSASSCVHASSTFCPRFQRSNSASWSRDSASRAFGASGCRWLSDALNRSSQVARFMPASAGSVRARLLPCRSPVAVLLRPFHFAGRRQDGILVLDARLRAPAVARALDVVLDVLPAGFRERGEVDRLHDLVIVGADPDFAP